MPLKNLQQGLLDQSVDDARHAELSDPAVRFGDFDPFDRLRLVGSREQLRPNAWPVGRCKDAQLSDKEKLLRAIIFSSQFRDAARALSSALTTKTAA